MSVHAHSMTGVGFAAGTCEVGDVRIEVRTTNGRGFAVKLRLPAAMAAFEAAVEDQVRAALTRGSAMVVVERTKGDPGLPDRGLLRAVDAELVALADELGHAPPTLADVLRAAAATGRPEPMTSRPLPARLQALLAQALDALLAHRAAEGAGTARAIAQHLGEVEAAIARLAERSPQLVADHERRLQQRVQELAKAWLPSPPPAFEFVREVAAFADRVDIAEELQRLRAHAAELRATLMRPGEVGKRLEFLLQELLRETNTAGSKSPDVVIAHTVVAMKTCIERMKEQAANLA